MLMPVRSDISDTPEIDTVLARHDENFVNNRGRPYRVDISSIEDYPDWSDEEWKEYEIHLRGYQKEQKIQAISLVSETLRKVREIKERKHEIHIEEKVRMRTQAILQSSNIHHRELNGEDSHTGYSLDEIYVSLWQCHIIIKHIRQKGLRKETQNDINLKMKVLQERGDMTPLEDILSYVMHDMTEAERKEIIEKIRLH